MNWYNQPQFDRDLSEWIKKNADPTFVDTVARVWDNDRHRTFLKLEDLWKAAYLAGCKDREHLTTTIDLAQTMLRAKQTFTVNFTLFGIRSRISQESSSIPEPDSRKPNAKM